MTEAFRAPWLEVAPEIEEDGMLYLWLSTEKGRLVLNAWTEPPRELSLNISVGLHAFLAAGFDEGVESYLVERLLNDGNVLDMASFYATRPVCT